MRREVGDGRDRQPTLWCYAACYGLYVLILALCFFGFWLWRGTAEVVVGYLYRRADAQDAVYLTSTLAIGLVLFVLAVGSEPYLRSGLERPRRLDRRRAPLYRLAERFARLAVPLVGSFALALVIQEWALAGLAAGPSSAPPAVAARATPGGPGAPGPPGGPGGARGTLAAPDTQVRGTPGPGPWIGGAALAVAGTIILAAAKRPK